MAGSDLSELIGSYLHVKTHYRVVWDVCDQFNECRDEEDSGLQDKLDLDQNRNRAQGGSAADQSNNLRFDTLNYKQQIPLFNLERTVPAVTCSFEFVVTDRQDKLIMLKHSQEIREFVLTINFRQLFIVSVFISADGDTVYLQDKAIKYNDYMASM